jgi:hypothetical protein
MVVLRRPKEEINEKEINEKKLAKKKQNSPIDIFHGIQEDSGAIPWIHHNAVNRYMPIFIEQVMLVDVP